MKLFVHKVNNLDRHKLRARAAREGWLVESPSQMRAGFGEPLVSVELVDGLDGSLDGARLFGDITVEFQSGIPDVSPMAFVSAPFDRSDVVRLWIASHTFIVDSSNIWLISTSPSAGAVLEDLDTTPDSDVTSYAGVVDVFSPTPNAYVRLVTAAVEKMHQGTLKKVVLARRVEGTVDRDIDPAVIAQRFSSGEPSCTIFAISDLDGGRFIGASPELIVCFQDGVVSAHPLAGTVALPEGLDAVDYEKWLLGSAKNQYEHRLVVEDIVHRLKSRCVDVHAEKKPSIVALQSLAHLGTWIHGKIDDGDGLTAFELLATLHPTPAVGGLPSDLARDVISDLEPTSRGLYSGAVGWFDAGGNGEWWISFRGVTVHDKNFRAWAGAGIVPESDPIAEREETRSKLAAILCGLGDVAV